MTPVMAWFILILAGCCEPVWIYCFLKSQGFSHLIPSVLGMCAVALEFALFNYALRYLPLNVSYFVWVGVGAISVFLLAYFLGENINFMRLFFISLIMIGVFGMKFY